MNLNKSILILLPLSSMILANILYLIGISSEGKYSRLSILAFFFLSSIYFLQNYKKINFKISQFTNLLILTIFSISVYGFIALEYIQNSEYLGFKIFHLSKILFLYFIFLLISTLNLEELIRIVKITVKLFISVICLTLPLYFLSQFGLLSLPYRLIDYAGRYGGLSFEMVDFTYLLFISLILSYKSTRRWIVSSIFIIYLTYITKSNSIAIFSLMIMIFYFIYKSNFIRKNNFIFLLLGLFFIIMVFVSLSNLEVLLSYLEGFLPRMSASLDSNSPTAARLLPNVYSIIYLKDHLFDFPLGLNSAIYILEYYDLNRGYPSGVFLFLVDFGFIGVFMLLYLLYKLSRSLKYKTSNINILKTKAIILVSVGYLIFQPSYLSFSVWIVILLSFKLQELYRRVEIDKYLEK